MHPTTAPGRSVSPVDHDLQNLYNEVWANFAEEGQATDGDIDNIYSDYGADPNQRTVNGKYTNGGRVPPGPPPPPHRLPPASPPRPARRLPPTPGGSSSSVGPAIFTMPEPQVAPYSQHSQRPSHYSTDSFTSVSSDPNELLRRATAANANSGGRRLPPAPGSLDGNRTSPSWPGMGLPSDPRPVSRVPKEAANFDLGGNAYGSSVSRSTSIRPPGAQPPAIPGEYSQSQGYRISYEPTLPAEVQYSVDNRTLSESRQYHLPSPVQSAHSVQYGVAQTYSRENVADYSSPVTNRESRDSPSSYNLGRNDLASSGGYLNQQANPSPYDMEPSPFGADVSRGYSATSSLTRNSDYGFAHVDGGSGLTRNTSDMLRTLADYSARPPLNLHTEQQEEFWEDEDEEDPHRFINLSLLSHIAVQLRDKVPRGTHTKGSIPYPRAFTGKDIVSTIQSLIQRELAINHGISTNDRRTALHVARSLQSQLFFYEVEWGGRVLQDGVEDVYMFLDDNEGTGEREELPTGVVTMLTRCYSASCADGVPCYAYACPRKGNSIITLQPTTEAPAQAKTAWSETVEDAVLNTLPESEINRQTIIHKLITKEEQYLQDIDIIETIFLKPLRNANPAIISPLNKLEEFIDEVFGNILDLRECNRHLLEVLYVRQREQAPVIQRIGDVFLDAAVEFRLAYPFYIAQHPAAEKRMKDEMDSNPAFRLFLEQCSRQSARQGDAVRLDLKHFLNRPSEHLQKYPVLLEAVMNETDEGNPDSGFLKEAVEAMKNLQSSAQLRTFQIAMGKGPTGKWEWYDLVDPEFAKTLSKKEAKRQSIIFELIKGEMAYVKDLENIEAMYIIPLRDANPPIIEPSKLEQFIHEVFNNFTELFHHHRNLVEKFHAIQREEHPVINSITAAVFDAALNFRDAYLQYIPNYPIAAYRIDDEMANSPPFKAFVDQCVRHPDAHRLDMKNFINRPIPRLLRYELLLKGIMEESPEGHEDHEAIPHVVDVIKALGKETEPGVQTAKEKVELWRYNGSLVYKPGEYVDMDLLDESRSLKFSGKLLRQPESGLEMFGWSELYVLLFDNYLVMTKPKEKESVTKYHVNRRPIPLELLTLVNFTDPPTQRSAGILKTFTPGSSSNAAQSPESAVDPRSVYPFTLHHNGRLGGTCILYAESAQSRDDWKKALQEAVGTRMVVQDSNRVFTVETLSADTFLVSGNPTANHNQTWNQSAALTGKVTCSVPFNMRDGRGLVAIGCAEGVWIGFRHDPNSMRRVLHLKMVTQCAMLEDFGIFLVLADKSLFAYHIEALVPSSPQGAQASQTPQKLNGSRDVHFFSVGTLHGRTLIAYMKKNGLDSVFRVLEPVMEKINERGRTPMGLGSRLGFRSAKSEWFRVYREFFLPSDTFDLIFLKARIAILCVKGFEIMDLQDFDSVTIPHREDPRLGPLAKRCEACRPMGMFRSKDDEFLLVYDEFGLYVDKHGDPTRSAATIEWENTVERVALHPPYVLLFNSRFIEIRHIATGRLAQIIPGHDIRCIWDGRGVGSSIRGHAAPNTATNTGPDGMNQEAQVHAVMNVTDPQPGPGGYKAVSTKAIAQHVFELVPTVLLDVPQSATVSTRAYSQSLTLQPSIASPRSSVAWK
ncbi:hypothetical protein BDN72DRAFT_957951 [Pluteus cervinus]|uniref:Uncharacterized protein n=1 Tax=Pluteus cervinus TaxID=181527 RepID=A0ACD3B253_9AGAR|nr:hypothetical protein BDN72DRAFT_957951 [Pluteus cervinus]